MELWLPYGHTEIPVRVPDDNFYRILEPKPSVLKDIGSLVQNALDNPVAGLSLKDRVKPVTQAGIIVDPIVPIDVRNQAVAVLTSRLSALGVEKTKLFVRKRMFIPDSSLEGYKRLDPSQNSFTEIGKTSIGTSVDLDPELQTLDLKINVGITLPHFATGLTGGPDAVIPSSSSVRSITKNRSLLTKGIPGPLNIADNPVLSDSFEASRLGGPIYSICFVPDGFGGVVQAFAGEVEPVFREAASKFAELHRPRIERKVDVVIVSAGPSSGTDLYHAIRVVDNVLGAVKREGTVILVAECSSGIGNSVFLDYARMFRERRELSTEMRYRFKLGAHINLLLQDLLEKCRIQLVSVLPELFVRDTFDLKPSQTATEAIQKAIRVESKEAKILIVPRGDVTVPIMEAA